jgi:D-alanine-D-alanine ligase
MAKVGVVFGGRSVEHRVSIVSARTVAAGLEQAGHQVVPLAIAPDGCWLSPNDARVTLQGGLDAIPPSGRRVATTLAPLLDSDLEVVFPVVHGTWGEDGTLQGLLEMLDLAYVGAGVEASALAMDKLRAKRLLQAAGVPVVDFEAVSRQESEGGQIEHLARLNPPLFVKPSVGGSSVGVRKVTQDDPLAEAVAFALRFDDMVLVERAVEGRELECAILGYRELQASAVGEVVPGNEFYDYADKYLQDTADLKLPAELPTEVAERVRALSCAAVAALGVVGMARVDFLLEGDSELFVNEINTLPGFTAISMYPKLWELSGVPLPELVDRLVAIALERHADRRRLDQGIKAWLADL